MRCQSQSYYRRIIRHNKIASDDMTNIAHVSQMMRDASRLLSDIADKLDAIDTGQADVAAAQPTPKRKRAVYSDDFESFWHAYPTDQIMSKKEAARAWQSLTPEERLNASRACTAFRSYCQSNPTYRPVHACRFLSQRRFEGFASAPNGHIRPPPDWLSPEHQEQWIQSEQRRIANG